MASGVTGSVSVALHPLVILNISDHWIRMRSQEGRPVQGESPASARPIPWGARPVRTRMDPRWLGVMLGTRLLPRPLPLHSDWGVDRETGGPEYRGDELL